MQIDNKNNLCLCPYATTTIFYTWNGEADNQPNVFCLPTCVIVEHQLPCKSDAEGASHTSNLKLDTCSYHGKKKYGTSFKGLRAYLKGFSFSHLYLSFRMIEKGQQYLTVVVKVSDKRPSILPCVFEGGKCQNQLSETIAISDCM